MRIATITMMAAANLSLITATASDASDMAVGIITPDLKARIMKLHDTSEYDGSTMTMDPNLDPQNLFTQQVINPVSKKISNDNANASASANANEVEDEHRRLQNLFLSCEDSDPDFDGRVCILFNYPTSGFNTGLYGCLSTTESTRNFYFCDGCLVYSGDARDDNYCNYCSLCSDHDIGFDCTNQASGDCAVYNCVTGVCMSGRPTFVSTNPPPPAPTTRPPPTGIPPSFSKPPPRSGAASIVVAPLLYFIGVKVVVAILTMVY